MGRLMYMKEIMKSTLIKNATIFTASDTFVSDIWIEGERISVIGKDLSFEADTMIDANGKYVIPGGVEAHTHFDMPLKDSISSVDDFEMGTIAAACGGTTSIIDYAAHEHGELIEQGLENWFKKAEGKAVIDYGFHMSLSEFTHRTLKDMELMVKQGVTSFKVFTAYPGRMMLDDATIFRIMKKSEELGALVCVHAENGHIIDVLIEEALAAGHVSPKYHPLTRPPSGEAEAVHRVITLAELANAPILIVHISCSDVTNHIMEARGRGLPIYGETCPQYLFLSDDLYSLPKFEGAKYVMSPPLRDRSHHESLWQAIQNRTIQTIGTDHCPFLFNGHKTEGKDDFTKIPGGIAGVETRMGLMYTGGVCEGRINMNHFVDLVSTAPAKLFGLYPQKGTIAPGSDADMVLFDPSADTLISAVTHHCNADYSPYEGMRVKGMPGIVLSRGEIIAEDGKFLGTPGTGRFLKRTPQAFVSES